MPVGWSPAQFRVFLGAFKPIGNGWRDHLLDGLTIQTNSSNLKNRWKLNSPAGGLPDPLGELSVMIRSHVSQPHNFAAALLYQPDRDDRTFVELVRVDGGHRSRHKSCANTGSRVIAPMQPHVHFWTPWCEGERGRDLAVPSHHSYDDVEQALDKLMSICTIRPSEEPLWASQN